jgi:hypothetical protein
MMGGFKLGLFSTTRNITTRRIIMVTSVYIDPLKLAAVINKELPDTTKVGTGKEPGDNGRFISAFVSFDRESGDIHTSQDGERVKLNIKYSR